MDIYNKQMIKMIKYNGKSCYSIGRCINEIKSKLISVE